MASPEQLRAAGLRALRKAPYTYTFVWDDGTVCRLNLLGPGQADLRTAQRYASLPSFQEGDFVVFPHPDDERPGLGSETAFDGGTLTLVSWSATPYYTATPVGVARWTR